MLYLSKFISANDFNFSLLGCYAYVLFMLDVKILTVKETIKEFSIRYFSRLGNHDTVLAIQLLYDSEQSRRLKRYHPLESQKHEFHFPKRTLCYSSLRS